MSSLIKTILVVAVVGAAGYYGWGLIAGHGAGGPAGGAPPVSVAEVIERDVQQWNEFSGRLVAIDHAEIRPQVSGIITEVHFQDGAMVKKDDPLFTIDPRPYQAALEAAKATHIYAQAEYARASSLLKDKATPKRDADEKFNAYQQAKAALTKAQLDLDYTNIRSPIDGRVSRAEITAGNLVEAANAPVLTTVVSSTPIYADFEIDEGTFLQYARAGVTTNQAEQNIPVMMGLGGETGAPHAGHVESFDNRLSSASGTIRVRAVFDNADGVLVPGLFARLRLGTPGGTKTLLITDRAIGTDQNKKFVLAVGADNKVAYREIKLGAVVDGLRVVTEGLNPGDRIIVNGIQRAHPGSEVTPTLVAMDTPPAQLDPSAGAAADAKPADAKPEETKPADAKPAEEKPVVAQPAEDKPAEAAPADAKPVEITPSEAAPAPADVPPPAAADKPADVAPEAPADAPPATDKPADDKPAAEKQGDS